MRYGLNKADAMHRLCYLTGMRVFTGRLEGGETRYSKRPVKYVLNRMGTHVSVGAMAAVSQF